jgi:hypothetical protein
MKLNKFIALTMLGCFAFPIIAAEPAAEPSKLLAEAKEDAKAVIADGKSVVKKVTAATKAKAKKMMGKKKHAHHAKHPVKHHSVECNAPAHTAAALMLTTPTSTPDGYMKVKENVFIGIHGYAQANVNYDFKGYAGDFVDVSTIGYAAPTNKNVLSMHVKQTRLNLMSLARTTIGDVKARLEMDFYGDIEYANTTTRSSATSHKPRMRHAYVEAGGFLVGQTDSLFASVYEMPVVNFQGMFGYSTRQIQIRYTFNENEPMTFAVALSQPVADGIDTAGTKIATRGDDKVPDFTAKLNYKMFGHDMALRGALRQLSYKNTAGQSASKMAWGVGLNGKVQVVEGSSLVALIDYGTGIGRYSELSGQSVVWDALNNKTELQKMLTWGAGYSHRFCEQWQVNLGYSQNSVKQAKLRLANNVDTKSLQRIFFNIIYSPVQDLNVSLEYGNFRRKSMKATNLTEQKGTRDRVSLAVQYKF